MFWRHRGRMKRPGNFRSNCTRRLTYLLLEGIGGLADADNDGTVSVREIIDYATAEMPNLADRLSQEPISQKPVAYSRGADFAVAGL